MGLKPRKKKHWLGRPPRDAKDVFRLSHVIQDEECWVLDDGEPGIAFSGRDKNGYPVAWGPTDCDCDDDFVGFMPSCPMNRAMNMTSTRYGAANGHPMHKTKRRPSGRSTSSRLLAL